MSERPQSARIRRRLGRVLLVLLLAVGAAGCDRCGDFVSPLRLLADQEPAACRDQAPKPR